MYSSSPEAADVQKRGIVLAAAASILGSPWDWRSSRACCTEHIRLCIVSALCTGTAATCPEEYIHNAKRGKSPAVRRRHFEPALCNQGLLLTAFIPDFVYFLLILKHRSSRSSFRLLLGAAPHAHLIHTHRPPTECIRTVLEAWDRESHGKQTNASTCYQNSGQCLVLSYSRPFPISCDRSRLSTPP